MNRICPHCNVEIPEGEEAGTVELTSTMPDGARVTKERVLCDEALDELAVAMLASGRATVTLDDSGEEE